MAVSIAQIGVPVDLRPVMAPQREQLLSFLRRLDSEDWLRPTACEGWRVADLVAHLVGDVAGRVSGLRDGRDRTERLAGESLGQFVDRTNQQWVIACRRLSPELMLDMLEWLGPMADQLWWSRGMSEPSIGVSWAGLDPAPVWMDAAREVTEYWVHERQLREAVGDEGAGVPPVATILDVFSRGLPNTLARVDPGGEVDCIRLDSAGCSWRFARRENDWWMSEEQSPGEVIVTFDEDVLWRRWTRQPITLPVGLESLSRSERAVFDHVGIVHSDPNA